MADESKEGIVFDSLAFLTKKLIIEGVFLQTYEFKCQSAPNENLVRSINNLVKLILKSLCSVTKIKIENIMKLYFHIIPLSLLELEK